MARVTEISAAAGSPKRVHSYSRMTTALAVLALATAAYSLLRLDSTREKLDQVRDMAVELEADRNTLRTELGNIVIREQQSRQDMQSQLRAFEDLQRQLRELAPAVEELKGRAAGPERAWSRAEALFLVELAQRRLVLDRDVDAAIAALESADTRLAGIRDATFAPVRQQIAKDLQSLRSVRVPDITRILAHLSSAEEQVSRIPVKGIVLEPAADGSGAQSNGASARAWTTVKNTLQHLITVRRVDDEAASVVSAQEQSLRRQHLQLLLFAARTAAARRDSSSYRTSLASARRMLGSYFDLTHPAATALLDEVQALEPIDIDPQLPDLSATLRLLQKLTPGRPGPE